MTGTSDAPAGAMVTPDAEEYTWTDAARDLALVTSLNLREAIDILQPLQIGAGRGYGDGPVEMKPYDAVPLVQRLVTSIRGEAGTSLPGAGYALRCLMDGKPWPR